MRVDLAWRDGRTASVSAAPDEAILDAAERADVPLPFGCRIGVCGSCTAQLREGGVEHGRPPHALKPRHLRAGYVLPCVAVPTTDCRLEVGADVPRDLVENPFV